MITNAYIKEVSGPDRRYVTEIQEDDVLGDLEFTYVAEPYDDIVELMNNRTAALNGDE